MEPLLLLKDVSFRYKEQEQFAVHDINMSINQGEWIAIVGQNGSGKSTLAKLLNGLYVPTEGDVYVDGFNTKEEQTIWEVRKRTGLVFQNPDNQLVATTVRDDIAFGLENLGVPREEMLEKIERCAKIVAVDHLLDEEPHRLSGGQKQRVAIAGILAVEPKVMILDEATSMLDPIGRKEVVETMQQLNKQEQITIISITHDLAEAALADKWVIMDNGTIGRQGTTTEVFSEPKELLPFGLRLPFALQVASLLQEKGIAFASFPLNEEQLVEELWKYKCKM